MTHDARSFIAGLPDSLAVQKRLLGGLLTAVEADPRWEWLELGCSVAAGRGDELSDLDMGLGFLDPAVVPTVDGVLRGLGAVVDVSAQPYNGMDRWWVQYADGGQIDLVAMPAANRPGLPPGSVALLDRAGRLSVPVEPSALRAGPDDPRHWLLDGWEALSNVAKYLRRGSLLEALDQVQRARQRIFQLWAAGDGVPYPLFGLTSLLDEPQPSLPDGISATYGVPTPESVLTAARATARLLGDAGTRVDVDTPLREYVTARLAPTVQTRITEFWSTVASGYDAHGGNVAAYGSPGYRQWVDALAAALPDPPADVLDVATGTGYLALAAASLGHRVTAIDLAPGMLEELAANASDRGLTVDARLADAVHPDLPPATFDVVTSRHFLWTLRDPATAMANWRRLLRPGGRLLAVDGFWFTTPTADAPPLFTEHYTADTRNALPFMHLDDPGPILAALTAAGFTDASAEPRPALDLGGGTPYFITALIE